LFTLGLILWGGLLTYLTKPKPCAADHETTA
jgi:hypothetical protein